MPKNSAAAPQTRFADHEGYDGVMLVAPGRSYHLEFTHHRNDDLLCR